MNGFNLVYFDENGKEFKAKAITNADYVLLDPETGEKKYVTRYMLTRSLGFKASKANAKGRIFNRPRRFVK